MRAPTNRLVMAILLAVSLPLAARASAQDVPLIPVTFYDVQALKNVAGYIDSTGVVVIEPKFEQANRFYDGLALVKIDGKFGYIDATGELRIPAQYEQAWHFSEGYGIVSVEKKLGCIDQGGKVVIAPRFDNVEFFQEGMSWYAVGDKRGFMDKDGRLVVTPTFANTRSFSEGLAAVKPAPGAKWGFIDKTGAMVIQPRFEGWTEKDISDFSEGLAVAQIDEDIVAYWVVIDTRGNIVFNTGLKYTEYPKMRGFHEGLAVFHGDGRGGFMTRDGKIMLPEFDDIPHWLHGSPPSDVSEIRDFHDGLAAVKVNDKWGYIRRNGTLAIAPQYERVGDFGYGVPGVTWVQLNGSILFRTRTRVIFDQSKAKWDSQARKVVE